MNNKKTFILYSILLIIVVSIVMMLYEMQTQKDNLAKSTIDERSRVLTDAGLQSHDFANLGLCQEMSLEESLAILRRLQFKTVVGENKIFAQRFYGKKIDDSFPMSETLWLIFSDTGDKIRQIRATTTLCGTSTTYYLNLPNCDSVEVENSVRVIDQEK